MCGIIENMHSVPCFTTVLFIALAKVGGTMDYCKSVISSFRYIPAVVDHSGGLPCHGTYLLHQVSAP